MRIILRLQEDGAEMTEESEVRPLGGSLFEVVETPLSFHPNASCGDIVRLRSVGESTYEIEAVVQRPFGHWDYLIPGTFGASRRIYEFGEWVTSLGGRWECLMHGLLLIHLPATANIADVESELNARLRRFIDSEEHARLLESGPPIPRFWTDRSV